MNDSMQISRSIVIGLGSFGLQVISLLLPRLEVYYQFVAPDQGATPLAARCGLVRDDGTSGLQYYALDRSIEAFAHVCDIQYAVLTQDRGSSTTLMAELDRLLGAAGSWRCSMDQKNWLEALIRPVLADARDYTNSFAHLNIYLVASAQENPAKMIDQITENLTHFPVQMHVNLLLSTPSANSLEIPIQQAKDVLNQMFDSLRRMPLFHRVYLIHNSKINQAVVETAGEAVMAVCNFLDGMIFSKIGDTIAENSLPDSHHLHINAPYSSFGAAKLYVPIAEVTTEIVDQYVAQNINEHALSLFSEDQQAGIAKGAPLALNLEKIGQLALNGLPIVLTPRSSGAVRLRATFAQLSRLSRRKAPINSKNTPMRTPHLQISRRYWRDMLRERGRPYTIERWWSALEQFEADVLDAQLPKWLALAEDRLGVSIAGETLVYELYQASQQSDPIAKDLLGMSLDDRADKLQQWVEQRRPDLAPHMPSLRHHVMNEVFQNPTITAQHIHAATADWLGRWLRQQLPNTAGNQYIIDQNLRRDCAQLIATQPGGLRLALVMLQGVSAQIQHIRQARDEWQISDQQLELKTPLADTQHRLKQEQHRLVATMHSQPYPAALMARLAVIWLLPMAILLIVVLTSTTQLPVWWAMYQTEIVVGWPMMIICIYIVRMGYYRLRVWRAQLRIERLVLANIDRAIEHQIYDQSPERPTRLITSPTYQATSSWPSFGPSKRIGLIPAYLQVLDRELIAPGLEGTTQPTSLLATLQGAVADFERFSANPHPIGRTIPCMVYRSIGDVLVRELFEKQLHREHDHMGDYWKVLLASDLAKHLTSAASLTQIIKQTLRTGITRDSVKILRTNSALHLLKLLQLPENEHMGLVGAVDELQCCAKPLLNVTPYIHLSESTREMAVYLSVDESIVATLRATVQNREAHRFISSSCDPFGMHCIIVLNGLTLQSLPFG